MEESKKGILSRLSVILPAVIGMLMLGFLAVLLVTKNVNVYQSRSGQGITSITEYTLQEREAAEAPIGIIKSYRFSIPDDLPHDTCLAFYVVHQYVDVYLADELVYRLTPSGESDMVLTTGSNWVMIPVYHEDAGKEVRVDIEPVYESFRNRAVEFLLGSELAIYRARLRADLPALIISGLSVLIGLIYMCVAGYLLILSKTGWNFMALGAFAALLGLWRFTDTRFSPFFLNMQKPVLLYYISILALMFGSIPLMKMQKEKLNRKLVDIYCILSASISMVQVLLQLFGIMDLRENLIITHVLIIAGVCMLMFTLISDWIRQRREKKSADIEQIMLLVILFGILMDVFFFFTRKTSSGILFTLAAFICYMIVTGISFILSYRKTEQLLMLVRVTTMVSQIKSHFIFNVLNAISGMCKYDPEKADRTIVSFARYLRANIDILQDDRPMPFDATLEQLESYIELERIRFGDKIRFVKEIETDQFMMPLLILQPIVENAIKHGLLPKPDGGTITLRTWESAGEIHISVQDDGVGFDVDAKGDEHSVGLKNVRFRLKHIMNGRLEIQSVPGSGTTVTISIPISRTHSDQAKCKGD